MFVDTNGPPGEGWADNWACNQDIPLVLCDLSAGDILV